MSEITETLVTVEENRREDNELMLFETMTDGRYMLTNRDETFSVKFSEVSAYIEREHEWADFRCEDVDFHIKNKRDDRWPHWLFEELHHIELNGELRPMKDYEETYKLTENRGIKAGY